MSRTYETLPAETCIWRGFQRFGVTIAEKARPDPKSGASANSATFAGGNKIEISERGGNVNCKAAGGPQKQTGDVAGLRPADEPWFLALP